MRDADRAEAGRRSLPRASRGGRRGAAPHVLSPGTRWCGFRVRHPPRDAGRARQPAVPVPPRGAAGDRESGAELSHRRRRARLSAFVFSVGHRPGRRLTGRRAGERPPHTGGARYSGSANAEGRTKRTAVNAVRGPVAPAAGRRQGAARADPLPGIRSPARRRVQARDGAPVRQHRARRPRRARPVQRGLHVRQRAARAALWHSQRDGRSLPPRDPRPLARVPSRPSWARQLADGHLGRRSHLARCNVASGSWKCCLARRPRRRRRA